MEFSVVCCVVTHKSFLSFFFFFICCKPIEPPQAVLFCCVLWVWAGAGGEFMRKPVEQWGTQDVLNWLGGLGEWTQGEYSELFKSEASVVFVL